MACLSVISEIQDVADVASLAWMARTVRTVRTVRTDHEKGKQEIWDNKSRSAPIFSKGPWILVTIDLYSRYIDLQYIGNSATIENIIKHLKITFHKIGKPYFFKGQETNKNAVVESNIKTVKNLILKYIYNFGIPTSIQMMLDIVTEEFNNHYHKGIKTTP
jgi:hypothetical protein